VRRPGSLAGATAVFVLLSMLAACGSSSGPQADREGAVATTAASPGLVAKASLRHCPVTPKSTPTFKAGTGVVPLTMPCLGSGEPVLLTELGHPAVLNLWASWCGPCAKELPMFAAVDRETADRVLFLGVDTADRQDAAFQTLIDAGVHFPSVYDPQRKVQKHLGLVGLPATVFLRADGSIAHIKFGAVADATELRTLLRAHLGVVS